MEFRVVPSQTGGLLEPREAAVLTKREHSNTGGTVVNQKLIIPQRFFMSLCGIFYLKILQRKSIPGADVKKHRIPDCIGELPT